MGDHIKYRRGIKYQLWEDYWCFLSDAWKPYIDNALRDFPEMQTQYFAIRPNAKLVAFKAYCWDGPSGPTVDTPDSLRGSLVHDVLYQAIRLGFLPAECRHLADLEFHRILLEDGMNPIRARAWFEAVKHFAGSAADPASERPVLTAP